jgi:hypothetical protein
MNRRGAVLFETLVATAVFVGVGTFSLSAIHASIQALERAHERQQALDIARSKISELDCGLTTLTQLRGDVIESVGSFESMIEDDQAATAAPPGWEFDVNTVRTEFTGLTLVELTVYPAGRDGAAAAVTLRQLVRLRGEDAEEYAQDPLLEGLDVEEGGP